MVAIFHGPTKGRVNRGAGSSQQNWGVSLGSLDHVVLSPLLSSRICPTKGSACTWFNESESLVDSSRWSNSHDRTNSLEKYSGSCLSLFLGAEREWQANLLGQAETKPPHLMVDNLGGVQTLRAGFSSQVLHSFHFGASPQMSGPDSDIKKKKKSLAMQVLVKFTHATIFFYWITQN